uniref:Calcium-dependent protein kinase, isoform AK1 n=1 Tax=Arundo donax TaxID=35708 RepID=A0A0A8YMX4_ARUDO
MAARDREWGH